MGVAWLLVPNISLGPFVFGSEVAAYIDKFGARLEVDPDAGHLELQTYSLPNTDGYLGVENGILISVTVRKGAFYKGVDIVGLRISELDSLLGCSADDCGPAVEYDSGEAQTPYDYFEFGLQVWTVAEKVVSVSCLDYREDSECA